MVVKTVMRASPAQRDRIKLEEGLRLKAYRDTVSVWTIGYGRAATNPLPVRGMLNGKFYEGRVVEDLSITLAEADRLFDEDMNETERSISAMLPENVELTQSQFDALCDFVHQYGAFRLQGSTLMEKIAFNPNSPAVLEQFMRWTQAGGVHREYVWRRSARRCCVYTGTLIPQKLWRKASTAEEKTDGYPFALIYDGGWKIDYSITPTIDKLLAEGRRLAKKPEPDYSKPLPQPTITVIVDKPSDESVKAKSFEDLVAELPPLDLTPDMKADPPKSVAVEKAEAPEPSPKPAPASSASEKTVAASPATVQAGGGVPINRPPPPVASPRPPEPLPPSVPVSNNTDYGPGLRNMFRSKRFWGGVLIIGGRFVIIADAGGHVSPFIRSLIGDSILMDWTTGLLVNMIGEGLMSRGEKKAEAPLGTPREVALYTPPPVRS